MPEDQIENAEDRAKARLQQDRDDLNNEVAGRDTGRIKRFVAPEHIGGDMAGSGKDSDFQLYADVVLRMERERQERLQAINDRFERINRAYDQAIAESERELQAARLHMQDVYNNGTKMSDGRVVFRDDKTGLFHDKNDVILDENDQVEARQRYNESDTDRNLWLSTEEEFSEESRRVETIKRNHKEFVEKYESGDMTLDELEEELFRQEQNENLKPYLDTESRRPETSVSKDIDGQKGITSKFSATPAFSHAGSLEQPGQQPAPDHDSRDIKPQNVPGTALV